jgi:hypothetical protein
VNVGLPESSKLVAMLRTMTSDNDGLMETGKETKENDFHAEKVSTEMMIGIMSCTIGQTIKSVALVGVPETCEFKKESVVIGLCIGHVGRTGCNGVFRDDREQVTREVFVSELVSSQGREQCDAGKGIWSKHVKISTRPMCGYCDWEQRIRADMITRQHVVGPSFMPQFNTSKYGRGF